MASDPDQERALELSPEQMRALGYQVVDLLVERFATLREQQVTRHMDRASLEARLHEPAPRASADPLLVLEQMRHTVLNATMPLDHPRFFAFVPSPSNFVSVMADTLAAGLNIFAGSWLVASGPAEIEIVTIDWLRQLCGLPDTAGGLFVSGGSLANLTALAVARHVKLRDDVRDAVIYCSDQAHSSIERALFVLGFAPDQLRKLPSEHDFRLSLATVRKAVNADRAAGRVPFCVVASAGTTNTGAVDPLMELADFCQVEGLWLHVDGSYGAPANLTEYGQRMLRGLDRADSISLDPHKWLFQPIEIGCLLVREHAWLRDTFAVHPEYLKDVDRNAEEVNFRDYGIQLTRASRALKLWMSLKVFGLDAFRAAVAQGIALAELAESELRASSRWEVVTPAQMGIVTFRFVAPGHSKRRLNALNQAIVDAMIVDGFALVTSTVLGGRTVLRLCTINPRTTHADIRETIHRLERFGEDALRND